MSLARANGHAAAGLLVHGGRATRRSVTVNLSRVRGEALALVEHEADDEPLSTEDLRRARVERPLTRGGCIDAERPCPWVGCRHHLALDVELTSIKVNFPGTPLDHLPATCALDVADEGEATLERVGELLNVTRERARQIEEHALERAKKRGERLRLFGPEDV